MRDSTIALLKLLSAAFPGFRLERAAAEVWDAHLEKYTPEQLARAGQSVMMNHAHGNPSLAVMVQAIEGRVVNVQVPETDLWNRVILDGPGGRPRTKTVPMRVGLDGVPLLADDRALAELAGALPSPGIPEVDERPEELRWTSNRPEAADFDSALGGLLGGSEDPA